MVEGEVMDSSEATVAPGASMIRIVSITTISGLLLLGVASLAGEGSIDVASLGVTAAVLGWTAAISTMVWLCQAAMEIFMAYYSESSVNGVKIGARKYRRLVAPLAMHAVAILACVPAIRQDARWLVGVCLISLAGVVWQWRISKTLI